jgi:3-dehydroquinate dehydratase-2
MYFVDLASTAQARSKLNHCQALNAFDPPVIEVPISNVQKREEFRHPSFVSIRADGVIAAFGAEDYLLALRRAARLLEAKA